MGPGHLQPKIVRRQTTIHLCLCVLWLGPCVCVCCGLGPYAMTWGLVAVAWGFRVFVGCGVRVHLHAFIHLPMHVHKLAQTRCASSPDGSDISQAEAAAAAVAKNHPAGETQ